jgi:hypothetical protein
MIKPVNILTEPLSVILLAESKPGKYTSFILIYIGCMVTHRAVTTEQGLINHVDTAIILPVGTECYPREVKTLPHVEVQTIYYRIQGVVIALIKKSEKIWSADLGEHTRVREYIQIPDERQQAHAHFLSQVEDEVKNRSEVWRHRMARTFYKYIEKKGQ